MSVLLLLWGNGLAWAGELQNVKFNHQNTLREYILYRPDNLPPNAPLVFVLHDAGATNNSMMLLTQMNGFANVKRFTVVYPQALPDKTGEPNWRYAEEYSPDLEFLTHLAQYLQTHYQVSPQHTFAVGYADGGFMTYMLACKAADTFKAVAVVGGKMFRQSFNACAPSQPVPVLHIHGVNDTMVPIDGTGGHPYLSDLIKFWARVNRTTTTETSFVPPLTNARYHRAGTNGHEVWLYKIHNWGHEWPGASSNTGTNASQVIMDFLSLFLDMPTQQPANITLQRGGNGSGTFTVNEQRCEGACPGITIPYVIGQNYNLQVQPAAGSTFLGWYKANIPINNSYQVEPGDVITAMFQQEAPTPMPTPRPTPIPTPKLQATPTPKMQSPYANHLIPGRIEAEDYDLGGEGLAYHDTDSANQGGAYRTDRVDVYSSGNDAYYVGAIAKGEWLAYTINVPVAGDYDIQCLIASKISQGRFHLELDGVNVSGPRTLVSTGGWQNWREVYAKDVKLPAGQHVLKLFVERGPFNFDAMIIEQSP